MDSVLRTFRFRSLLRLINRRDLLSLSHENLAKAHGATVKSLSDREMENIPINEDNQRLVHELLELTGNDPSWREEISDENVKTLLSELEAENKKRRAEWEIMKNVSRAIVVGSGVEWAEDETLQTLVFDADD